MGTQTRNCKLRVLRSFVYHSSHSRVHREVNSTVVDMEEVGPGEAEGK